MTPEDINKVLIIPEEDNATPIKENEAKFLYDFLSEKKLTKTVETGFAYARSASHIISATGSRHIAMDPFQDYYQNLGLKNIEKLGLSQNLDFHRDFSHNVLPAFLKEGRKFEFIFIDGDHKFDGELIDFYYADLLLENNGYVLLHDTWMRSTRLVMAFIRKNRKDYKKIKTNLRNFALYQKVGNDTRNGMHFSEFYTFRMFFVHKIIIWLTNGEKGFVKKIVLKLKDAVK